MTTSTTIRDRPGLLCKNSTMCTCLRQVGKLGDKNNFDNYSRSARVVVQEQHHVHLSVPAMDRMKFAKDCQKHCAI